MLSGCLQVQSTLQYGNVAFSPYGLASMSILLFEGATGNTALEIMRVMKLPWNTLLVRIGFRDINRHLKVSFRYIIRNFFTFLPERIL